MTPSDIGFVNNQKNYRNGTVVRLIPNGEKVEAWCEVGYASYVLPHRKARSKEVNEDYQKLKEAGIVK